MLTFAECRDQYIDPCLIKRQKTSDLRAQPPNGIFLTQPLHLKLKWHLRRSIKIVKDSILDEYYALLCSGHDKDIASLKSQHYDHLYKTCNNYTSQHVNMGGTKFHKATGNQWMLRENQFSSQKTPLFRTVSCRHLYMWATLIGLCVYMHICRYVCIITIITTEEVMIQEEVGSRRSLTEEKKG